MKEKKELVYYDQDSEVYHKYRLIPSEHAMFDTKEFFDYLYSMKLDPQYSSSSVLQDGVTTGDLRRVYSEIIESKEIDFSVLCDLYDLEKLQTITVLSAHINKFLSMYDLEIDKEYSNEEVEEIVKMETQDKEKDAKEEKLSNKFKSIKYNSIFLNIIGFNIRKHKNKVLVNS